MFRGTIVPLSKRQPLRPRSVDKVVADRNGGLLLTCRRLNNTYARASYYKLSAFESKFFPDTKRFLATLDEQGTEGRELITKLHCNLTLDLLQYKGFQSNIPFLERILSVDYHSRQMYVLVTAQRFLDELALYMWKQPCGVETSVLAGIADVGGYKIKNLVAMTKEYHGWF